MLRKFLNQNEIRSIELYDNSVTQRTMTQVMEATGCDIIFNGGFFTWTDTALQPTSGTVINGRELCDPKDFYGFAFRGSDVIFSYGNNAKADHFLASYPNTFVRHGEIQFKSIPSALNGSRGRTCMGIDDDGNVYILVQPDGVNDYTLTEAANELILAGAKIAINLDGGGSSQYIDEVGNKFESSRTVSNFVCIYLNWDQTDDGLTKRVKVAIDPGHTTTNVNGNDEFDYSEYEYNLKISNHIKQIFDERYPEIDCRVFDYPEITNGATELNRAINDMNAWGAQYGLSIHSNAFSNSSANGFCVFAYSGQGTESYEFCNALRVAVTKEFPDLHDRGVIVNPNYIVVRDTYCKMALLESGFHTNETDVLRLIDHWDRYAEAYVRGVVNHLNIEFVSPEKPVEPSPPVSELSVATGKLVSLGIMDGTRLDDAATRGEVVLMLNRLIDKFLES